MARAFLFGKNYDGASYALKHADEALDEMHKDNKNEARRTDIAAMRKDVNDLQEHIKKKDPNMIDKATKKIDTWWENLKNWAKDKK